MPKTRELAAHAPIARVLPLLGLSIVDRFFEYKIDTTLDPIAQPGVRIRTRFNNRMIDGLIIDRVTEPEYTGELSWLDNVVSPEVVYSPQIKKLVEALSARYAGVSGDLIRHAIPSRHAGAEKTDTSTPWAELGTAKEPDLSYWSSYVHGESFVDAVLRGHVARAAWQMLPGEDWAAALAALAVKVVKDGDGALIILPDQRDVDQMDTALRALVSPKQITILTAAQGPQARYSRFLSILHGQGRLVIGTRSAVFAPVANLKLAVIKDDGDSSLVEPRSPYFHAREVLTTRSTQEQCSLILASYSRTAETQLLVESAWAHDLVATRDVIRTRMPYIHAAGDSDTAMERDRFAQHARLPSAAYQAISAALGRGAPALVQVPRKGYIPTLACRNCRTPARCRHCNGPLGIPAADPHNTFIPGPKNQRTHRPQQHQAAAVPTCSWCGRQDTHYHCTQCGSTGVRAVVLGQERTAEEFGHAFPRTKIITSGGNKIIPTITAEPTIVIATPGAEPQVTAGRYGAAVLLDTWALLGKQDLRATEETLAKWAQAASLVASNTKQGEVVVVADPTLAVVQHFIRWDMVAAARKELTERRDVHFPPAAHMAAIDGPAEAVTQFMQLIDLPEHAEVLGPVDLPPGVHLPGEYDERTHGVPQRILIRTPLGPRNQLGAALKAAQIAWAVRRNDLPVRTQVDPIHIG
ncbi:MAG: primosomal protein N' [Corynebacterium sp.]|nr:primosomal protein N' [Corynebacterium sp.]